MTLAHASPELVLDAGALSNLAQAVGAENMDIIVNLMLASVPATREALRVAAISGDADGLVEAAHQLKSDCAHMGATALAARLQQIESGARAGTPLLVAEVERVSAQVDQFLEALRRERGAP